MIHRDLKPSNVMVGAFGEVQVMDWGIARSGERKPETGVVENGEPAATVEYSPSSNYRTPHSDLTQAGAILGTPAYMPPEQAIGAIDQIGKHSDVFGLGAILCVILTGKPPYAGADAESNRQLAARAKLDDAFSRLDTSGAEPELVALAKRCLAAEPANRPRDAGEVAEAVEKLRAEAERRAREAEMDRARAEVKTAEERKRRHVQRVLAITVLGLLAVGGGAVWWIDRVRSQRRADQQAQQMKNEAEEKDREAERKARQLAHERNIMDTVKEVQLRLRDGQGLDRNLDLWFAALNSAALTYLRLDNLLQSGEPTDALRRAALDVKNAWERDNRDRLLLVELDRISDSNEIRLLIPVSFTSVTARQFAAAFRTHGIDLLKVPTDEAVAWLKGHRLRNRLVMAIRIWQQSYPPWDAASVADVRLMAAVVTSAAVAGNPPVMALIHAPDRQFEKLSRKTGPHARLKAILDAVTEDSFTREWWDAVGRNDVDVLKKLIERPEIGRMSSRELASLAEGVSPMSKTYEALGPLLEMAYERFPGEFWVHFRMAFQLQVNSNAKAVDAADQDKHDAAHRHLTAALAIRPYSAIARAALGMELIEKGTNEAAGIKMLRSATEVDPTSPWPHLFLGMWAIEKGDWPEAFRALKECIRVDPDTGFFMTSASGLFMLTRGMNGPNPPTEDEVIRLLNELIALHPNHPGGYDLLGQYYYQMGNHREALASFKKANPFASPDHPPRTVAELNIVELEAQARWEEKLPAVLRGELKPAGGEELAELAGYCATFEKKFALATRFAHDAIQANPTFLENWMQVSKFAGWAIQAAAGHGTDAATLPLIVRDRYRRQALEWMREMFNKRQGKDAGLGFYFSTIYDFAPVRDAKELVKLPPAERAEWEKLWAEITPPSEKSKTRETAPPPRAKK